MSTFVQLSLWVSYSSSCPLYLGNLIMTPSWQISLVVLSISIRYLGSSLCCAHYSRTLPNVWYIAWSPHCYICYLFVSPFFFPIPSHSCDPLEDLLPSLSQHGSVFSTSWWWRPRVLTIVPQDSLPSLVNSFALVVNYPLLVDKLLNPFHVRLQVTLIHMDWIVLVLWDPLWRP